jgi:calcineurin-like phosphoesterase family protein
MENQDSSEIKKEVNSQVHKHLSTIFIVVGIVSFTLGAIVNYYTIRRLNGKIFLILGSHDGNAFDYKDKFVDIKRMWEFRQNDIQITLCHYSLRVWPKSHYNSWHLYGHSHGYLESFVKSV